MHTDTDPAQLDGYEQLLAAVIVRAWQDATGRDAHLRTQALVWLLSDGAEVACDWLDLPVDVLRRGVPRQEGEAVTVSVNFLQWALKLPAFGGLTVLEDGRMEISQSYKAATEQELRAVLLNYLAGDRLDVKRQPSGWVVEISRRTGVEG